MRHFQLIALGLAFTLVGCQLPLNLPHAMTPSGQSPNGNTPGVTPTDTKAPRMGTLRFAVRWPERSLPGFTAQVIPISTEKLVFRLSNPTLEGFVPIEQVLPRQAGEEIASTTLHLPEGAGYNATVTAYDKDDAAIAANTATNVTVTWGKSTPVPITLDALFAPIINNLGLGHGTPGQTVSINGTNFARGETVPVVIFPSGVEALGTREGGTISATIPTGAGSGQLKVKVDGVTSTSMAMFQEVRTLELSAEGAEEGGIRDGDGAIASWLGDTFPIGVVGKDTAHALVNNPALTGWTIPNDGVGEISHGGVFSAKALGYSSVTAQLGNVSSTSKIVIAPPAGPLRSPAGDVKGIVDLDLTKVGDNWLATWYEPNEKEVYWRMLGPNGEPDPRYETHSTAGAWDGFEHACRVSAAPDSNGNIQEICLAYRLTINDKNSVVFLPLDPLTGAMKNGGNVSQVPVEGGSRLLDLVSNGTGHAIAVLNFDGSKYSHRILSFKYNPDGTIADATKSKTYSNDELVPYSYREDTLSLAVSGSHYIVARHIGTGGGSGPSALHLEELTDTLSHVRQASPLHEFNRIPAVATNGDTVLVAAMELQASGTVLKLYRYRPVGDELDNVGLGYTVAQLNISGSDPLNWPVDLDWDGTDFILTYGQKVSAVVDGKVVHYPQSVVQRISVPTPTQTIVSLPFPLARESQMATLEPTPEGGMALWLDSTRRLAMRRVKYR